MKKLFLLAFFFTIIGIDSSAQFSIPKLSMGVQYSDVISYFDYYTDGNTWKRGIWASIATEYVIQKWIAVEINITYQERKPLEVFAFPFGDSTGMTGEGAYKFIISKYPTSPQSKIFFNSNKRYIQFPNFKYLDVEIIPIFKFGKKVEWRAGVGIFGGILLNQDLLIFGKEHFPAFEPNFRPPFSAYGTVSYHRYDYGWIPKISCTYPINAKTKIGLSFKSYQSRVRLNDNFAHSRTSLHFDMRWTAFLAGVDIQHKF